MKTGPPQLLPANADAIRADQIQGNVCFKSLRRSAFDLAGILGGLRNVALSHLPRLVPAAFDLGGLRNVGVLRLSHLPTVQSIDVSTCAHLKRMDLRFLPSLQHIRGLDKSTNLEDLSLAVLPSLQHIRGLDKSTNFRALRIQRCGLEYICGLDKSTNLAFLCIGNCKKLKALHIHPGVSLYITDCRSLERITCCTTSSYPEADCSTRCSTHNHRKISICRCPTLSEIDGLLQYTGAFFYNNYNHNITKQGNLEGAFGDLLESAGIDSSICKASVKRLVLTYGDQPGLAALRDLVLVDAQHIGLLISPLLEAEPQCLEHLVIHCKKDGDCGCDKNAPHFGPFPKRFEVLKYCCPKVRDLASLAQWDVLKVLILRGCTNVEVWPDFATLTALEHLDLSYTPLKVWPDFGGRTTIALSGCWQLSAEEFIKVIISHKLPQMQRFTSVTGAFLSLRGDLKAQRRDRCSVVDALYSHYTELVALFQQPNFGIQVLYLVTLMYDLWFEEVEACNLWHTSTCSDLQTKMRGLILCSQSFLSISYHWHQYDILSVHIQHRAGPAGISLFIPFLERELNRYGSWHEILCGLRTFALVGEAISIGWDNASVNEHLKDRIITFVKWFSDGKYEMLKNVMKHRGSRIDRQEWRLLSVRVGDAVCKMARVASVAAELGQEFMHTGIIQGLQARVQQDQLDAEDQDADDPPILTDSYLFATAF